MNTLGHLTGVVAVGLLLAATEGRAQQSGPPILLPVNLALTATIQNPEGAPDGRGNVKETTTMAKLTSAGLLAKVATARSTNYQASATLAINTDGHIVVACDTNVVDDLSDLFSLDIGASVSSGMYNVNTRAWNDTSQMRMDLAFNDSHGTCFDLSGILKVTDKAGPANTANQQIETLSCTASLAGDGTAINPKNQNATNQAIWTVTISGKASGTVPVEDEDD